MCGIAGLVTRGDSVAPAAVAAMTTALQRRGPDSDGLESWPRAVLGHRRLAIFDLTAAGHQPMVSDDRAVGLVFNGAIYNFRELRSELVALGYAFNSETDTEVLVQGYRAWGLDTLVGRLRGMFAFALWDQRSERLFLVRDRLGVKPLLYALRGGSIAFASTVRALQRAGFASEIDPLAVGDFLELGYITEQRAIYAGVAKVPAASIVEWSQQGHSIRRYWSPPRDGSASKISFRDAVAETERLLLEAVQIRLHADVPVAALLSGGVDSSLVCWAIARLGGDVTAYTIGTPGAPGDETADATATARVLGIRHEVLEATDRDAVDLEELATAYAEPFACSSALGMLRLSRAIANASAKVLLTGDGGDDVFLGYDRHRMLQRTSHAARWIPSMLADAWRQARRVLPHRGAVKRAVHLIDYATGGLGAFLAANPGLDDFARRGLLGERMGDVAGRTGPAWSIASARDSLRQYLAHDLETQFVGEYLTKVDGATMHHGLEARAPFFDHPLWEFASSLPFETRLHGGELKAILREIARQRIGERVAAGRKRGFHVPVEDWIGGRWHQAVATRLREPLIVSEGWVRAGPLAREVAAASATGRASRRLWYLLVLEEWFRSERGHQHPASLPRARSA